MITNFTDNIVITGTKLADQIVNNGDSVTINSGNGNDIIHSYGSNVVINGGAVKDQIYSFGKNSSISADKGDDIIWVSTVEGNTTVTSGTGKDTIGIELIGNGKTAYTQVTVTDLNADDTIYFDKPIGYLYAYVTGNDLLFTNSMNLTVKNITNKKLEEIKKVRVIHGDYITTIGNLMTRKISIDDNVAVYGTQDYDSITVYGKNNTVYGYDGNDDIYIANGAKNITVYSGNGNDYISSNGDNVVIYGNEGNDYFFIYNSDSTSIVSGEGDDTVCFGSGNSDFHMNGGAGDDYFILPVLYSNSEIPTITGGTGKDIIKIESWAYRDTSNLCCQAVITDLKANEDVLSFYQKINSLTASKENNNLVLKDDSGVFSVTLTGVTSTDEIKDVVVMNNETGANSGSKTTIGNLLTNRIGSENQKKTQLDVIREFMSSLDKIELTEVIDVINEAINNASGGHFQTYANLIESFIADCKKANNSETFLKNYCGIDLNNDDTGAITGWDAGGIIEKTSKSVIPENNSLVNLAKLYKNKSLDTLGDSTLKYDKKSKILSFTKCGLTLSIPNYDKVIKNSLNSTIVNGLYSWWIEESLEIIEESYGMSFNEKDTTTTKIILDLNPREAGAPVAQASPHTNANGVVDSITLWINTSFYSKKLNLNNDPDGTSVEYFHDSGDRNKAIKMLLDRNISHELTHAIMEANVNNFNNGTYDDWGVIAEGTAELTHGADDTRDFDGLINSIKSESLQTILNYTLHSPKSLSDVLKVSNVYYVFGYSLLRYFTSQVSKKSGVQDGVKCSSDKTSIKLTSEFKGTFKADEYFSTIKNIDASKDKNAVTIYGNAKNNNILGGSGKDNLYGDAGKDVLNGGAGNDILTGGKGSDNLTGGKGKDIFVYANGDGKDTITDYTAGQDKIKITKGSIGSFKISGTDVVFTIGKGSINVKNGAGKKITVIDSKGKETSKVYGISRKVSSLWFADEDTKFSTYSTQIDSISKSGSSDYSLGNVDAITDWTALTPTDSLTSALTFSDK